MSDVDVTLLIEDGSGGSIPVIVHGDLEVTGGDRVEVEITAGMVLSGHRIVTPDVNGAAVYAQPDTIPEGPLLLTTGAWSTGELATVVAYGVVDEPSWNWTPRTRLFLAPNGFLTQAPPVGGVSVRFAFAVTPTRIFIDTSEPFVLAA